MAKKVFGYIRRSLEKENLSLQAQEKSIRAFAESQSWNLLNIYCDPGDSGKTLNRPGFQKMMSDISNRSEKIDLILVMKLDRVSRHLKDILVLIEDDLQPKSIGLKSVTETFDSSTAEGRLMISMLGSFAEFERNRISERMMDGKLQLAENGGWNGGLIPFGYHKCPATHQVVPHPADSETVRSIFNLFVDRGLSSIKLRDLTSCPLHRDSIYDLLSNPFYVGLVEYAGQLNRGIHEPVISLRLFNKAQEMKLQKARTRSASFFKIHGTSKIPLILSESGRAD
nr:hypothetical protein HAGR004_37860 [Bdellovibrio sp. HAGR004]